MAAEIMTGAQNIFIKLHVCAEKILEPDLDPLLVCCHFERSESGVDESFTVAAKGWPYK